MGTNTEEFPPATFFGKVSKAVKEWYDSGCANTDLENVFIGHPFLATERPKYEKL